MMSLWVHACARGLLQSGLGRFGLLAQKQPQPGDYSTAVIFVVGGISLADLREARQAIDGSSGSNGSKTRVIMGGTTLLVPADLASSLFQ